MVSALEYLEKENRQKYMLKYLMLKLAPVLLKLKPAHLVALCNLEHSKRNNYDLWIRQKWSIARTLRISFKELRDTLHRRQVLFYDPQLLFDTITRPESLVFLKYFGYSSCKTVEDYLELLKVHFNGPSFPHEIGIFLGYPLKDVKGFVKKGGLPLTKLGSWQVFGEPGKSIQLMQMHRKAVEVFLNSMQNGRNPILFTERLGAHFRKTGNLAAVN